MSVFRRSSRRDALLKELSERSDHPTADELYTSLKKDNPSMGIATVYRNLSRLSGKGDILKFSYNGIDRYDGNTDLHYHLFCTECGRIYDLDYPVSQDLEKKVSEATGNEISSHSISFFGICKNCRDIK